MTDEHPRTPFYADGKQACDVSPFFEQMLAYRKIIEDTRRPYDEQKSAVLGAYELLRQIAAKGKDSSVFLHDPDYRKALYYECFLPTWEEKFKLILDGNEPRDRRSGQPVDLPKH